MSAEVREALYDKIGEEPWISQRELLKFVDKKLDAEPAEAKKLLVEMVDDGDIAYVVSPYYRQPGRIVYRVAKNSDEG